MDSYQVHLILEALCEEHSIEELFDSEPTRQALCRYLHLSEEQADILLEGALLLKSIRARKSETRLQ